MKVICDPIGFDGPIVVADLGCFPPGPHDVPDDLARRLLDLPHFRPDGSDPIVDEEPEPTSNDTPDQPA